MTMPPATASRGGVCFDWSGLCRSFAMGAYLGEISVGPGEPGQRANDYLAFTMGDVGRLGVEASAQGLGANLLDQPTLMQALKKGLISENIGQEVVRAGRTFDELLTDDLVALDFIQIKLDHRGRPG